MTAPSPAAHLERAIRDPRGGAPRVIPIVGGWPGREGFGERLLERAHEADVVLLIAPTRHPAPDGLTPIAPCRRAAAAGATLRWLLATLGDIELPAPVVLVSPITPLLAYGLHPLLAELPDLGVSGVIVPDTPYDERDDLRRAADRAGLALVQVLPPGAPLDRARRLLRPGSGFVGVAGDDPVDDRWLADLRALSPVPVCRIEPVG